MLKANSLEKNPDEDWGQEEKGVTEGETVGWHHRLKGQEFEPIWETVKDREAWRSAVHRVAELDMTW